MNLIKVHSVILILVLLSVTTFTQAQVAAHFTMPCKVLCFNGNGTLVGNKEMSFVNTSTGATTYKWTFTGGTPDTSTLKTPPIITYSTTGTYIVTLSINGGASTFSDTIKAINNCGAGFTTTTSSTLCGAGCLSFIDTSNFVPDTWVWAFSGPGTVNPASSYAQNPTPVCFPNTPGHYNVQLQATRSGDNKGRCFFENTRNFASVIVKNCNTPKAVFKVDSGNYVCAKQCIGFTDESINGTNDTINSWKWTFAGGTPSSYNGKNPPLICYNTPGNFNAKLVVSGISASDSTIQVINVEKCNGSAGIINQQTAGLTLCPCQSFNLFFIKVGTFNTGNIFTAQLSDRNGSFSTPVNIGTLDTSNFGFIDYIIPCNSLGGTKYATRIISSSPKDTSNIDSLITIYSSSHAAFTSNFDTVCSGQSVVFTYTGTSDTSDVYVWGFDGGVTKADSGQGPHSVSWTIPGLKKVSLVVESNCNLDTTYKSILVDICTGINSVAENNSVEIYPNPFSNNFTVKYNGGTDKGTIIIRDIIGREVARYKLPGNNTLLINLPSIASGVYTLNIITANGNFAVKKLVKF